MAIINTVQSHKDTVDVGIERKLYEELENIIEENGVDVESNEAAVQELVNAYINMALADTDRFKTFHWGGTE